MTINELGHTRFLPESIISFDSLVLKILSCDATAVELLNDLDLYHFFLGKFEVRVLRKNLTFEIIVGCFPVPAVIALLFPSLSFFLAESLDLSLGLVLSDLESLSVIETFLILVRFVLRTPVGAFLGLHLLYGI